MSDFSQSVTTVGNVVSTITFSTWCSSIEIVNLGGDNLWVRTDGVNPTVGGNNSIVIPASSWKVGISNDKLGGNNTEVRIISSTPVYAFIGANT